MPKEGLPDASAAGDDPTTAAHTAAVAVRVANAARNLGSIPDSTIPKAQKRELKRLSRDTLELVASQRQTEQEISAGERPSNDPEAKTARLAVREGLLRTANKAFRVAESEARVRLDTPQVRDALISQLREDHLEGSSPGQYFFEAGSQAWKSATKSAQQRAAAILRGSQPALPPSSPTSATPGDSPT
ncbi:MAG: hypothetical protein AAF725_21445 [Acidobacteriota bacterium]